MLLRDESKVEIQRQETSEWKERLGHKKFQSKDIH